MITGPLNPPKFLTFSVTFANPASADAAAPTAGLVEGHMRVDTHDLEKWRIASDDPPPKPREPEIRVIKEGHIPPKHGDVRQRFDQRLLTDATIALLSATVLGLAIALAMRG